MGAHGLRPSLFHLKGFACYESGIMRSLNPDEQELPHPIGEPAEPWMVEAMKAQILTRARDLSHVIRACVFATLQKHAQAEPDQPQRENRGSSP
jgi:hypothetical protein